MNPSVLLLTLLVALFVQQQVEAGIIGNILPGKYYERIYDRIGRHLEKESPFEKDPSVDFNRAIDWLNARISSATFSVENDTLSTVLNQLKALEALKDDDKCNSDSLKVLEANNRATNGRALKFHDEFNSKSRIVMMVHHYFLLHANSCKRHYADLLNSDCDIDQIDLETVRIIRDGFFVAFAGRDYIFSSRSGKYVWRPVIKEDKLPKISSWESEILINRIEYPLDRIDNPDAILKYLSREDPDKDCMKIGKGNVVPQIRIKKLYEKYMVDPCRNYIRQKAHIWLMQRFDHTLINMYGSDVKLLRARIGYKICEDIVGQDREAIFESIIESLKDHVKQWLLGALKERESE